MSSTFKNEFKIILFYYGIPVAYSIIYWLIFIPDVVSYLLAQSFRVTAVAGVPAFVLFFPTAMVVYAAVPLFICTITSQWNIGFALDIGFEFSDNLMRSMAEDTFKYKAYLWICYTCFALFLGFRTGDQFNFWLTMIFGPIGTALGSCMVKCTLGVYFYIMYGIRRYFYKNMEQKNPRIWRAIVGEQEPESQQTYQSYDRQNYQSYDRQQTHQSYNQQQSYQSYNQQQTYYQEFTGTQKSWLDSQPADIRKMLMMYGITSESELTMQNLRTKKKEMAKQFHPDLHGGSDAKMKEANASFDSIVKYFNLE